MTSFTETENNNSFLTANALELGNAISGQLSDVDDKDIYQLEIITSGELELQLEASTDSIAQISVYDHEGKLISSFKKLAGGSSQIALEQTGTYFVSIEASDSEVMVSDYTLNTVFSGGISPGIETEGNNSLFLADELAQDGEIKGNLYNHNDIDFYRVEISEQGLLSISFDLGEHNGDYESFQLALYDSNTNLLHQFQSSGGNLNQVAVANSGTYYIGVMSHGYYRNHSQEEYTLALQYSPGDILSYELENNDSLLTANHLSLGAEEEIKGNLHDADDMDYYRVEVSEPGVLSISLDLFEHSGIYENTQFALYDSNANLLHRFESRDGSSTQVVAPYSGTYYIGVTTGVNWLSSSKDYVLSAEHMSAEISGYEIEGNDSLLNANQLPMDTEIQGQISGIDDNDFYRVDIPSPTTLTLSLDLPLKYGYMPEYPDSAYVSLFDQTGELINSTSISNSTDQMFISGIEEAGSYYLGLSSYDTLPYTLKVNQNATVNFESENNNTFMSADELAFGSPKSGRLQTNGDEDFYQVNVTETGMLKLSLELEEEYSVLKNFALNFYNEQGEILNQYETGIDQEYLFTVSETGSYYVEITSTDDFHTQHLYTLSAEHSADLSTATEIGINDSNSTANQAVSGIPIRGSLINYADTDVYQIDISEPSTLMVDLEVFNVDLHNQRFTSYLYDETGERVARFSTPNYQNHTTDTSYGMQKNLEAGTYFLHLGKNKHSWTRESGLDYQLTMTERTIADQTVAGTVSVEGNTQVGSTLNAIVELSDSEGAGEFSYQWYSSNGVIEGAEDTSYGAIQGATDNSYVVRLDDSEISVKVSYTDSLGNFTTIASHEIEDVAPYTELIKNLISEESSNFMIQAAYVAYYGRPADPDGLEAWSHQLEHAGGELSSIMQAFGNSAEYDSRYGSFSTVELVEALYFQLLGRNGANIEITPWADLLQNGTKSLQTIALDILLGARNADALSVLKKIEFAEYFTEQVAQGEIPYQGVEHANAIAELMQNVERGTNPLEFDSLLADYKLMTDDQEHIHFVDLESITPEISSGDSDGIMESILPTSLELSIERESDELGVLKVSFNPEGDIKELLNSFDNNTFSVEVAYSLGFDINNDDVDDIELTFAPNSDHYAYDDLGKLFNDDSFPIQSVEFSYYDEYGSIKELIGKYDFENEFIRIENYYLTRPVVEFSLNPAELTFALDLDQTLPDSYSRYWWYEQMIENAGYLTPETLNSFSVSYIEQQIDLDTEEITTIHEGHVEYQFSSGDILFV